MEQSRYKGFKTIANKLIWQKMLSYSVSRDFVKIHNRSKTDFLQVAFSEKEAEDEIYVLVAPGGFWENFVYTPLNSIWVKADVDATEDIDVIYYLNTDKYDSSN